MITQLQLFIHNFYTKAVPSRKTMAQGFDAPPTLERSGSEHRRAVTSFLLRRKAWLEVELPLAKGRRRDSKNITSFF